MGNLKKWQVKASDPVMQFILSRELGVSPLMAQLLINRGIYTVETARSFLAPSLSELHSPTRMRDMDRGVELAARTLERNARIMVYGDYDVDGVTGTTLLVDLLRRLGGDVVYYIPQRLDLGYGLHAQVLQQARDKGVELVITVDCGIGNAAEVAALKKSGGPEIIITDHHEPPAELPPAAAVINPKRRDCTYPFRELAGVGVAYKFARALLEYCSSRVDPDYYLDLVCLGTVADIVPLHGENRILVKHGLKRLARLERPGLQALCRVAGVKPESLSTREVGYILAPRLNAAGRVGDAGAAVRLLLSEDPDTALELAASLGRDNQARQELETIALSEALGMLDGDPSLAADSVIVLGSPCWHPGVIGIVASRLVERYNKPVLLVACEGDRGKGSARSIRGFDLVPALEHCSHCLQEFGGHSMAAGFSIETSQIERFRHMINQYAADVIHGKEQPDSLELDALVSVEEITHELVNEIEMLEPYGHGNPRPLLGLTNAKLLQCRGVGKNEAHLKIQLGEKKANIDGIGFNLGSYADELAAGKEISVAFTPTINRWQGRQYLQIRISDLHPVNADEFCCRAGDREDDILRRAGDLIFVPETFIAKLKDYLTQNHHSIPGAMEMLQAYNHLNDAVTSPPYPAPAVRGSEKKLVHLEPSAKCILLLVNSARHTLQLTRFLNRHNPRFYGQVSFVNGFMPWDRINSKLHSINNGTIKLLVSTYSCLPGENNRELFDRVVMARPPATYEDWLAINSFTGSGAEMVLEAMYKQRDWEQNRSYLEELAPERDLLACCYAALRSLSPGGNGGCTAEEALSCLRSSGFDVSSVLCLAVAVAIFSDLDLLHYRWEEGMLRYKILPVGGQRRELNASGTYSWTRKVKTEWLDWIESASQANGA